MNTSRFKILTDASDAEDAESTAVEKMKPKPPPIYI